MGDIASGLVEREPGFWVARKQSEVSYPGDGHASCLAVEESSFWFNHRNRVITSVVQAHRPTGPIFDVGGGNGYVSLALQNAGLDTVVVEPGADGAHNARQRGLNTVVQATLEDAGFAGGTLAAIGLLDVLEHIDDSVGFLHTLHRQLQPAGNLYLTVPAYSFLWSAEDEKAGHYRRYTRGSLAAELAQGGFELTYASYFFLVSGACGVPVSHGAQQAGPAPGWGGGHHAARTPAAGGSDRQRARSADAVRTEPHPGRRHHALGRQLHRRGPQRLRPRQARTSRSAAVPRSRQ